MLKAVQAYSDISNINDAVESLINQCEKQLGIFRPQIAIIHSSFPHNSEDLQILLDSFSDYYHGIKIIGSTVIAGFTNHLGYKKEGYFVTLLVSNDIQFDVFNIDNLTKQQNSNELEKTLKQQLAPYFKRSKLCITYPSYYGIDGNQLLQHLNKALGNQCTIFGGFSCDYWPDEVFKKPDNTLPIENSLQFYSDGSQCVITKQGMPCLLMSGDIEFDFAYCFGWSDDEKKYAIQTDNDIITQIDDIDPVTFLKKKRHPLSSSLIGIMAYPFWVHENNKNAYLRDIYFNESNQLKVLGGPLPSSAKISFSFPETDSILKEFRECINKLPDSYDFGLNVSCASRIMALGEQISHESSYHDLVLTNTPIHSVYLFGEFFPLNKEQNSVLHSCSNITLLIRSTESNQTSTNNCSFIENRIEAKNNEIQELKKQLEFFEKSKHIKENCFLQDVVGIMLATSVKSVSYHSQELQKVFKQHYTHKKPEYPISRNRIIERLQPLKCSSSEKFKMDK